MKMSKFITITGLNEKLIENARQEWMQNEGKDRQGNEYCFFNWMLKHHVQSEGLVKECLEGYDDYYANIWS